MNRRRFALVGALAIALMVAACGGGGNKATTNATPTSGSGSASTFNTPTSGATSSAAQPQTAKVKRGGTLFVAMDANPKDFDPMVSGDAYSGAVSSAVTEGLYKYNEKVEPVPWLAEKVDISSDGLTYTFSLRKGVKFHDGTEMDAEAVKFSVDRVRANEKSPGYADGKDISESVVVDKYTYKLVLKEASAPFPSRLTGRLAGIVSPTAVKAMGDDKFNQAPVGTGPFKFGEFKSDSYVRVEKFEGYWRNGADGKPLPYLDRIEWRIITEPGARFTALQAGDVDISSIRDQDAKLAKEDKSLRYEQQAGFSFSGFQLNNAAGIFANKPLRQAVAFAIDRDEIIKAVYEGNREFGNGPIALPLEWAIDRSYKPYTYDQAKAKAKLAEGGQPNGFEFSFWLGAGNSVGKLQAELLQAQLAKVGIRMKIEEADFNGVVIPKWRAKDGDAWGVSWNTGIDPDQLLTNLFTKAGSFNYTGYENQQVTDLVLKARKTSDLKVRGDAYKEATKLIMDDSPYIVLVYGIDRFVGKKNVQGWYLGLKATTSYSEFWKE